MRLGYPSVATMLRSMTSRDVAEWAAYSELEPWDERRADLRAGVIASTIINMFSKRGSKSVGPEDFILFKERRVQTMEEQRQAARFITQVLGGKVLSGDS